MNILALFIWIFCIAFMLDADDNYVMQFRDASIITWILFLIGFTVWTLIDALTLTENNDERPRTPKTCR